MAPDLSTGFSNPSTKKEKKKKNSLWTNIASGLDLIFRYLIKKQKAHV